MVLADPSSALAGAVFEELFPRRDELVLRLDDIGRAALFGCKGELPRAESFFQTVADEVSAELAGVLPVGWGCAMSGSFVHGAGKGGYIVSPEGQSNCEVGDLLFALEYVLGGTRAHSALLVQAKDTGVDPAKPWRGAEHQRTFYADMPAFTWRDLQQEFPRPECGRTLEPDVVIGCPCGSGWLDLGSNAHWSRWFVDNVAPPKYGGAVYATLSDAPLVVPPLPGYAPRALAGVLADMFLFMGGWEFQSLYTAYRPDGHGLVRWSAVVWDILRKSAVREHESRIRSGRVPDRTPLRFADEEGLAEGEAFPPALMADLLGRRPPDEPTTPGAQSSDGAGGISVVRMQISGDWDVRAYFDEPDDRK